MRSTNSNSIMKVWLAAFALASFVALSGCGSVTMPQEHYYRIGLPDLGRSSLVSADIVRVEGFDLASALHSDRLLVAEDAVQLRAYEFHRWISPLQRLVQDAMTVGLSRAHAFTEVKGPTDGPGETLVLTGRILDFHQANVDGEWAGKVTIALRLDDARGDRGVVLQEEFTQSVKMTDESPGAAVRALSEGTRGVLQQFLERCVQVGVFADVARPGK
jgi:uncharacterized lipoprotein YmbA